MWLSKPMASHFGVGAPPILHYFSWNLDIHWGCGILTHGHVSWLSSFHTKSQMFRREFGTAQLLKRFVLVDVLKGQLLDFLLLPAMTCRQPAPNKFLKTEGTWVRGGV